MIALDEEKQAKSQIMEFLAKQGYPRYAALLSNFDVNRTADPDTVAYVENDRARIVVNKNLYLEQLSVVIRHELLHRWLNHNYRLGEHVGQDKWKKRTYQQHMIGNIAADYEISNRGYTDEDKERVRTLMIKDKVMRGLVTEDDHPDWVDLSVEEMYDKLTEKLEQDQKAFQKFLDELIENGLYQDLEDDSEGGSGGSGQGSEEENNDGSQDGQGGQGSGNDKDNEQADSSSNSSSGSSSVTVSIEDIGRALKIKKQQSGSSSQSSQSSEENEQESDYNNTIDDLIDAVDQTLEDITNNPKMSKQDKDKKAKDLLDKIREKTQQGKEKSDEEPTYDKSKEDISKELKDIAKKLEKEVAENEEKIKNPDLDRETIDKNIDLKIKNISDLFNDTAELNAAIQETSKVNYNNTIKKREKERKELKKREFNSTTYSKELFLKQLDKLIQSQLKRIQQGTYKVPSKKRVFGSNVLYRGSHWEEKRKKPSVIVYYDRSGSWQVPWKTKAGDDAISMLNDKYVRRGLLDLKLRYFANTVSDNPNKVGGGNAATQEILDDIVQQKATNVIILTDSDIDYGYSNPVTVPGGVFFIFVEDQSPVLTKYLHGKQLNQVYFISDESAN